MYTRIPDRKPHNPRSINIPENYGGNAFNASEPYNKAFGEPSQKPYILDTDAQKTEVREKDITPEISSAEPSDRFADMINVTDESENITPQKSELSQLIPFATPKLLKNHFPFGHGIGSEELLILGIMSLLFTSEDNSDTDGELIMLLALLLFAG